MRYTKEINWQDYEKVKIEFIRFQKIGFSL